VSALVDALRARGGTLASVLVDEPGPATPDPAPAGRTSDGPAQLAAAGPRAAGRESEYELLVEMILEGSRLHYGGARAVATDDRDLALLLGDQLYALGLERLAELGDLDAVNELADVISLVSQAHAAGNPELADAVWRAGAVAIGWGPSEAHEAAKRLARAADPRAPEALRAAGSEPGPS
jgi:hypothetical protein